jgi:hypothetical protein
LRLGVQRDVEERRLPVPTGAADEQLAAGQECLVHGLQFLGAVDELGRLRRHAFNECVHAREGGAGGGAGR